MEAQSVVDLALQAVGAASYSNARHSNAPIEMYARVRSTRCPQKRRCCMRDSWRSISPVNQIL
jgi:hypothetical protein